MTCVDWDAGDGYQKMGTSITGGSRAFDHAPSDALEAKPMKEATEEDTCRVNEQIRKELKTNAED